MGRRIRGGEEGERDETNLGVSLRVLHERQRSEVPKQSSKDEPSDPKEREEGARLRAGSAGDG